MKKHEEFDLEIAIERIQKKFLYEDVIKRLEEHEFRISPIDFDEYEESDFEFSEKAEIEENPQYQIVEEMLDWYEKSFGKLAKSEKDELRIEICYNYEIDFEQ